MGIDRKQLPDRLLSLVSPADRRRVGLKTPIFEMIVESAMKPIRRPAKPPKAHGAKYSLPVVMAWFAEVGLPAPIPEFRFHKERLFRLDFAWQTQMVGLEVQGGIFARLPGGHNRGAAIRKEHEKRNLLACMGWRILYCETETLCTTDVAETIRTALFCSSITPTNDFDDSDAPK